MLQAEFNNLIEQWKNMDRSDDTKRAEASQFYDEQVFPHIKEEFLRKPENYPPAGREYDGLILTVGLSPEPLILSIHALKPKRICLLYTSQTAKFLSRIEEESRSLSSTWSVSKHQIDGSDVVEIYRKIRELYEEWGSPQNLAVDITGGKKSMVSGAAMAGAVLGADIYYVDNKKFLQDFRKPDPGSEYLSLLENPYVVFDR